MPSGQRRHERLVDVLTQLGWRRHGLRSALRDLAHVEFLITGAPVDEVDDNNWAALADGFRVTGVIPDAWRIVDEGPDQGWLHPVSVLEVAEVVVTHPISAKKLQDYAWLWMRADACETVALRVWGFDGHGYQFPVLATFEQCGPAMAAAVIASVS